jgi:uncharacterized protein YndB with AHSA1/START domain
MLKKVLLALGALIAVFLIVVATRPATFHVERSASTSAPAAVVFPLVSDFHRWAEWSPWEKLDPAMKKSFEGGPGIGAKYAWEGNDKVGQGQMTITDMRPPEQLTLKLEFKKPFEATNTTTFTFKPAPNGGTQIVWAMDGNNNFVGKAMSLFMNMDSMVGKDFESGLADLTKLAEAEALKAKAAADAAAKAAAEEAAKKAAEEAAKAVPPPPAPPAKKKH